MGKVNHVYILVDCKRNEPFYVGATSDIKIRIAKHFFKSGKKNAGLRGTQKSRRIICRGGSVLPLIVFSGDRKDAFTKEHQFTLMLHRAGFLLENRIPSSNYKCRVGCNYRPKIKHDSKKKIMHDENGKARKARIAKKIDEIIAGIKKL